MGGWLGKPGQPFPVQNVGMHYWNQIGVRDSPTQTGTGSNPATFYLVI